MTRTPYAATFDDAPRRIWTRALLLLAALAASSCGGEPADEPGAEHTEALSTTLIAKGSVWKYLDNGTNQGTAWRGASFDDASWKSGPAELGYGDGDEATVVSYGPNASNKYVTTYFRRAFTIADPASVSALALGIRRDDGAVVYVNGAEVFRTSMPAGTIGYKTLASDAGSETTFYPASISPGVLLAGANVLAVEVHQGSTSSSDISFDLELVATTSSGGQAGTFGNATPGTEWVTSSANYKRASKFTLSDAGVAVSKLSAYVDGLGAASGSQAMKAVIYKDDGGSGAPGTLACTTTELVVAAGSAGAWRDLPVSGSCTLAAGSYYLGVLTGGPTAGLLRYSASPLAGGLWHNGDTYGDGPSNPFGTSGVTDKRLSIYATYGVSQPPPPDATPPAMVTNLAAGSPTASSLAVSWTAPGDDGNSGTAASYDLRSSTSPIDAANWAAATPIAGEPAPLAAGASQGMTVSGLLADTTYYFALKTKDEAANVSPLSNVASAKTSPGGSIVCTKTLVSGNGSLASFVAGLTPGQVGCLSGTFSDNVNVNNSGFTLRSAAGARAKLTGAWEIKNTANDVTLESLDFAAGSNGAFSMLTIFGDRVTLRDLDMHGGLTKNCIAAGWGTETIPANLAVDLLVERSRIHHCGPDDHTHGIYAEFTERLVIRDSYFYASTGYGIHFYPGAKNSLVEYTVVDGNAAGPGWATNVVFAGEKAGGEFSQPHASTGNVIRYSIITNPHMNYNVASYYPSGSAPVSGNEVAFNCLFGAPGGDFDGTAGSAYTQHDNKHANPQYVNAAAGDYTLQAGSPCANWGPR